MSDEYINNLEEENEKLRQKVAEQAQEISRLKKSREEEAIQSSQWDQARPSESKPKAKKVFNVDVSNMNQKQADSFMEEFIKAQRKRIREIL